MQVRVIRESGDFLKMDKDYYINNFKLYLNQFVKLEDKEWSIIKELIFISNLKKKDYLMKPSSDKNIIAFIISGLLRTYFISNKGEEYTTDFCKKGEIAVNYRVISNSYDDYYTQAVTETKILAINYNDILNSGFNMNRWNEIQSMIIEYYHPIKLKREKELLSMDAQEKYNSFIDTYRDIYQNIPQYQIASYLGITPIALSRIKKKIKDKK